MAPTQKNTSDSELQSVNRAKEAENNILINPLKTDKGKRTRERQTKERMAFISLMPTYTYSGPTSDRTDPCPLQ